MPRVVSAPGEFSDRHDEIIRVTTPATIKSSRYTTTHILDVYAIPPEGLEGPPYPLTEDTRGLIELRDLSRNRVVFRASVRALMDAYWRFALGSMVIPEDIPDLVARIREQLDALKASHGVQCAAEISKLLKQERIPGQNIAVRINEASHLSILRLEDTGCMNDSLRPIELQLYTVRVRKQI